jgi:hypothetical protein
MNNADVFFIDIEHRPKEFPKLEDSNFKKFWHTGIIYKEKVYECFNHGKYSVKPVVERFTNNDYINLTIIKNVKIDNSKLVKEIRSEIDCAEYVARVIGNSSLTGTNKGEKFPDDIYNLLKRRF